MIQVVWHNTWIIENHDLNNISIIHVDVVLGESAILRSFICIGGLHLFVVLLSSIVVANEKKEEQGSDPVELNFELVFDSDEQEVTNFIVVVNC